jgi:competence protein ComEC
MRAIAAFAVIFYFGVTGLKLLGYGSLIASALLCLALFPEFVFSIGFWLSFYGVFLIYLFLNSVKIKNKVVLYVALNVWLFFPWLPFYIIYFRFSQRRIY